MSEEREAPEATETDVEQAIDEATDAVSVQTSQLDELSGEGAGAGVEVGQLMDVPVHVTVEVGRVQMPLGDLVKLSQGALIELDREAHEPADILVNGKVVARGEIVTIGENYGVRITHVES